MIRITFVTGAGKLARQKYDENAAKAVSSTLRDLGYVEDRGASCVVECAGMFKSQHDTGKNLKTIVVFPMISTSDGGGNNSVSNDFGELSLKDGGGQSLLEEGSPKEMIAMTSSMNTFERMVKNKCPSWSQKKACLSVIADLKSMLETMDTKLLNGTVLTEQEQEFYDSISMDSIELKSNFCKEEMKKHVDEGNITKLEKEKLLSQVNDKIKTLDEEIDVATKERKPKKLSKLSAQKDKLSERLDTLENIIPKPPVPLKHQPEIQKLRKEMQPLLKLERETKGRLLTIKETTIMARKEEIEEEILVLEEKSRGWFEDDADFQVRLDNSRAQAVTAAKRSVKKSANSGSSSGKTGVKKTINWVVPSAGKKQVTKKPAKKTASSNAFAAMMMDSDSDSD